MRSIALLILMLAQSCEYLCRPCAEAIIAPIVIPQTKYYGQVIHDFVWNKAGDGLYFIFATGGIKAQFYEVLETGDLRLADKLNSLDTEPSAVDRLGNKLLITGKPRHFTFDLETNEAKEVSLPDYRTGPMWLDDSKGVCFFSPIDEEERHWKVMCQQENGIANTVIEDMGQVVNGRVYRGDSVSPDRSRLVVTTIGPGKLYVVDLVSGAQVKLPEIFDQVNIEGWLNNETLLTKFGEAGNVGEYARSLSSGEAKPFLRAVAFRAKPDDKMGKVAIHVGNTTTVPPPMRPLQEGIVSLSRDGSNFRVLVDFSQLPKGEPMTMTF